MRQNAPSKPPAIADDLLQANEALAALSAEARVEWVLRHTPEQHILTSSFGAHSAVMLHMVSLQKPRIPVVLLDTGYLFAETYRFVDSLTERFKLNLHVFRSERSAAWQEAAHGKLWEQGLGGLKLYNEINKILPLKRALGTLGAGTWFTGLRRSQSPSRSSVPLLEQLEGCYKAYPIADWTDHDVGMYLKRHCLPYHPLWENGYISIGDWHSTRPLEEAGDIAGTRFFGLKRECGIHDLDG